MKGKYLMRKVILICVVAAAVFAGCSTPWSDACKGHGGVVTVDGTLAVCHDGSVRPISAAAQSLAAGGQGADQ